MTRVKLDATKADARLIQLIVKRAAREYPALVSVEEAPVDAPSWHDGRLNLAMDLTAAHLNGCSLDLPALLEAEGFDFAHDLAGISRHLDRRSGKLGGCFSPRLTRREASR